MGGFVVNLTGKPFSSVAFDESHEMLINKDIKAAISRVEPDYIQRIFPYLPIRAKIIKKLKSQMNLDKTPKVNDSLTCISGKDTDFEKNATEIHDIALTAQLLPALITENRGLCNVFTNQPTTLQVKEDMFGLVTIGNREMDAFVNSRILNVPSTEPSVQHKKLKTFEPQTKKPKQCKPHVAEKHHKTLVKSLRKRIVNSVKRGEKITELEQFSEFPRALCDYPGNPVKGSKHLVTKLFQKRYPTSFSNTLPEGWKPEKVILEGMFMINTSPLPTQHKTFYDYGVFLVQK